METLSISVLNTPLPSSSCSLMSSSNKRIGSLKFSESSNFSCLGLRVRAQAREEPSEGEEELSLNSDFGLVSGDCVSFSQMNNMERASLQPSTSKINGCIKWLLHLSSDGFSHVLKDNLNQNQNSDKDADKILKMESSLSVPHGITGGGTRTGLFRTPISGGVQNAASAHGLSPPALAVRNLMEQARFAHLCTLMSRMHHRREGYPFGSLVDFIPDPMGHPIFSFSPLAIHTRNLLADPRCTLVVQVPGWSGLSNVRATIFGDIFPLPEDQQEWAHKQYIAKHQQCPSQQWANFYYFRMQNISDIYFIGGFGTVAWINVEEYETIQPDKIAVDGSEQNLKELNAIFSKPIKELLSAEAEIDDAALISIDSKGIVIRARQGAQFNIQRLSFDGEHGVETLEEAKAALWKVIK